MNIHYAVHAATPGFLNPDLGFLSALGILFSDLGFLSKPLDAKYLISRVIYICIPNISYKAVVSSTHNGIICVCDLCVAYNSVF